MVFLIMDYGINIYSENSVSLITLGLIGRTELKMIFKENSILKLILQEKKKFLSERIMGRSLTNIISLFTRGNNSKFANAK